MNILVTGGSGFVGSNLTDRLLSFGHHVFITNTAFQNENSRGCVLVVANDFRHINFNDLPVLDCLFHQAAITNTMLEADVMDVNYHAAIELFEKALAAKCKHIVYASSCAVYGNTKPPFREDSPLQPLNVYAQSKFYLDAHVAKMNAPIVGLRYSNVYGYGEAHKKKSSSMVYQIIESLMAGVSPNLFEWGEQKRDFVYINDVVEANLRAFREKAVGVYNIGSGQATSFNRLFEIIAKLLGTDLKPNFISNNISSVFQTWTECDISKAKQFGYEPSWSIEKGIKSYVSEICNNCHM